MAAKVTEHWTELRCLAGGWEAKGISVMVEPNWSSYLRSTSVIDFHDAEVGALAAELGAEGGPLEIAARSFYWVRDSIRHSVDHGDQQVTLSASDTLRYQTGLCYAKSHLLAAILRANKIPCGLVYQRLAIDDDGDAFCLHGLNAIWLDDFGWYRVDPRGDRPGITTKFEPPHEHLAFAPTRTGELILDEIFADPLPVVVNALTGYSCMPELCCHLPDLPSSVGFGQLAADLTDQVLADDGELGSE
ncbi:MAG: transglutaminase family protein [Pirellulales bacterium]